MENKKKLAEDLCTCCFPGGPSAGRECWSCTKYGICNLQHLFSHNDSKSSNQSLSQITKRCNMSTCFHQKMQPKDVSQQSIVILTYFDQELIRGVIPFVIRRFLPDNTYEDWKAGPQLRSKSWKMKVTETFFGTKTQTSRLQVDSFKRCSWTGRVAIISE